MNIQLILEKILERDKIIERIAQFYPWTIRQTCDCPVCESGKVYTRQAEAMLNEIKGMVESNVV